MTNKKCDMKMCRGEALRIGRFIAELSTKSTEVPVHRVFDNDLRTLGGYLNNLINYCSLKSDDKKKINDLYVSLLASREYPRGKKIAGNLAELMNTLYYSNDECKCERERQQ